MKNRFESEEKRKRIIPEVLPDAGPVPIPIANGHVRPAYRKNRVQIVYITLVVLRSFSILYFLFSIPFLTGCTSARPLKGGKAVTVTKPGVVVQTLAQSENPSLPSRQTQETIRVRTFTLPSESRITNHESRSPSSIQYPASSILSEFEQSRATTELGAAQRDTARETGAKLKSLRILLFAGLAMFVFGIASFAWPPLRALIGSVTTSAAITLGGVVLMVLPTLVVGHELLIFLGASVAVGVWCLAHRHGRLHGELSATTRHLRSWLS